MAKKMGLQEKLIAYMTSNADKPVTLAQLEEALGWSRSSVAGCAARLVETFPGNMERKRQGLYVWNSTSKAADKVLSTEMLVSVLTRRADGTILVQDTETREIYVMRQLEF
jgi:hypothetical protein